MINTSERDKLLRIVEDAEAAIMSVYTSSSGIDVTQKADDTPLTQADLASHRILVTGLAQLFPDIPVISEEGDEEENKRTVLGKSFWLVDPLDGTKEFIARNGEFTVCVALIEAGRPVFGIIAAPALGVIYYGGPGTGSYKKPRGKDAEPINVSQEQVGIVLGSRSSIESETSAYIAEHYTSHTVKAVGSQLKLPQIAEGLADVYPRLGSTMHPWDLAAGHAILEGAGGSVTHPDGSSIDYQSPSLQVGDFVASA